MQNFFDANRGRLNEVKVEAQGNQVIILAPVRMSLLRLFFLGSDKGSGDIGQHGQGFKAAAMCLMRDYGVDPVAISGHGLVCLRIAKDPMKVSADRTTLGRMSKEFQELPRTHHGHALARSFREMAKVAGNQDSLARRGNLQEGHILGVREFRRKGSGSYRFGNGTNQLQHDIGVLRNDAELRTAQDSVVFIENAVVGAYLKHALD